MVTWVILDRRGSQPIGRGKENLPDWGMRNGYLGVSDRRGSQPIGSGKEYLPDCRMRNGYLSDFGQKRKPSNRKREGKPPRLVHAQWLPFRFWTEEEAKQ